MTLGPRPESAGVIDWIPSLPIHSSLLIVVIAGLFLAALMLRAQRLPAQSQRRAGLTTRQARAARRRVLAERPQTSEPGADVTTDAREETRRSHENASFRIHWGRTLLALTGCLALLGAAGTAVAAWLTGLAWTVPAVCAGAFLLSLAGLQAAAAVRRRRARRARVERAMQEAMTVPEETAEQISRQQRVAAQAEAPQRVRPFDALSSDAEGLGGPDSLVTLDEDGLPENPERLFGKQAAKDPEAAEALFDQSAPAEDWQPREVPQPKYLVAEKVERPEPEPVAEEPAPTPSADTKLKQPSAAAAPKPEPEPSMDLDEVLKRRRA
ncbi:hypothetical protein [Nesterenkonia sp.]|uniref:hypothetical protein n=1 Tax=Nesterenkonia sp. TaxID=704201 RepID=UPI0026237BEA|nr:hypothetical protein [Nesterenkonia sp.]